jgi:hypothetical protein
VLGAVNGRAARELDEARSVAKGRARNGGCGGDWTHWHNHWDPAALRREDAKIERAEARYREDVVAACRNVINRFKVVWWRFVTK